MNRIRRIAVVIAVVAAGCMRTLEPLPAPPTDDAPALAQIADDYAIGIVPAGYDFSVTTKHGAITGAAADPKELSAYLKLFEPEFRLYPVELIRAIKLKRVVLCGKLAFAGQERAAVPDFEHACLYLDVSSAAYVRIYQRRVIHHELYHVVDWRDDGKLYEDERWAKLNSPKFRYGSGGKNALDDATTGVATEKFPGFLNHYSTTGVEEDKAEVFAHLVVEADYLDKRAAKDPVLRDKAERIKDLVAAFCPEMDAAFWKKARAMKREP